MMAWTTRAPVFALALALAAWPATALADAGAGDAGDAGADDAGIGDAGVAAPDDAAAEASATTPLACDGSLCDTTNDATCAVARGVPGRSPGLAGVACVAAAVFAAAALRRRTS